MRCLADFECELAQASTLEKKLKVLFEGLILNVFTTLKLDEIEYVSHKGRIERIRWLAPIYSKLEKRKRTIKKKIGLTLSS